MYDSILKLSINTGRRLYSFNPQFPFHYTTYLPLFFVFFSFMLHQYFSYDRTNICSPNKLLFDRSVLLCRIYIYIFYCLFHTSLSTVFCIQVYGCVIHIIFSVIYYIITILYRNSFKSHDLLTN